MPDGPPGVGSERRAVSFAKVIGALALSAALSAAGAWLAWRELIHYERRAALHVPPNADVALRLDVEQVVMFDAVRRHLYPLLARLPLEAPKSLPGVPPPDWLRALREEEGVNLSRDLRELVMAGLPGDDWVVLLGGLFPHRDLLSKLELALRQSGVDGLERAGDVLVLRQSGAAFGQTADGLLVIASRREVLPSAAHVSSRSAELGLDERGGGSFGLTPQRLRVWFDGIGERLDAGIQGMSGALEIGRDLELVVRVRATDPGAALQSLRAIQPELESVAAGKNGPATGPSRPGLWARLLESPTIQDKTLISRTFITAPELDAWLGGLARALQDELFGRRKAD